MVVPSMPGPVSPAGVPASACWWWMPRWVSSACWVLQASQEGQTSGEVEWSFDQVLPGDVIADVRSAGITATATEHEHGSHIPEVLLHMGGSKVCREKVL